MSVTKWDTDSPNNNVHCLILPTDGYNNLITPEFLNDNFIMYKFGFVVVRFGGHKKLVPFCKMCRSPKKMDRKEKLVVFERLHFSLGTNGKKQREKEVTSTMNKLSKETKKGIKNGTD